jgi:hypothetical protein
LTVKFAQLQGQLLSRVFRILVVFTPALQGMFKGLDRAGNVPLVFPFQAQIVAGDKVVSFYGQGLEKAVNGAMVPVQHGVADAKAVEQINVIGGYG